MANPGALASEHVEWLEPISKLDTSEQNLIVTFLLNTPALGVSRLSSGFISRFNMRDAEAAQALRNRISDGMHVYRVQKSANELKESLESGDRLTGDFWAGPEFICMTASPATEEVAKLAQERRSSEDPLARQRGDVLAQHLNWLNSFFKHLRNSIAHGSFARKQGAKGSVWIFQDSNTNGNISARIVATDKRVRAWRSALHQLEKYASQSAE